MESYEYKGDTYTIKFPHESGAKTSVPTVTKSLSANYFATPDASIRVGSVLRDLSSNDHNVLILTGQHMAVIASIVRYDQLASNLHVYLDVIGGSDYCFRLADIVKAMEVGVVCDRTRSLYQSELPYLVNHTPIVLFLITSCSWSPRFVYLSALYVHHSYYMYLDAIQRQPVPVKRDSLSLIDADGYVNEIGLIYFILYLIAHMHVTALGGVKMPSTFIDENDALRSPEAFYDRIISVDAVFKTDKAVGNPKAVPPYMAIRLMVKNIAKRFKAILDGATKRPRGTQQRYPTKNQLCVTLLDRSSSEQQLAVPLTSNLYVARVRGTASFHMISCECAAGKHGDTCPCELNGINCTSYCKCGSAGRSGSVSFNDNLVNIDDRSSIVVHRKPSKKSTQARVGAGSSPASGEDRGEMEDLGGDGDDQSEAKSLETSVSTDDDKTLSDDESFPEESEAEVEEEGEVDEDKVEDSGEEDDVDEAGK